MKPHDVLEWIARVRLEVPLCEDCGREVEHLLRELESDARHERRPEAAKPEEPR